MQLFFSTILLNVSFRRGLIGRNLNLWHNLVVQMANIRLNNIDDKYIWSCIKTGVVTSMYGALICDNRLRYNMMIWKLKVPLKIKIFMWYLKRGVVLTKDNIIRRNWKRNKMCVFCSHHESIQHLFF